MITTDIELTAAFEERLFNMADSSFVPQLPGVPDPRTRTLEADTPPIVRKHCASEIPFLTKGHLSHENCDKSAAIPFGWLAGFDGRDRQSAHAPYE